eukprot:7296407-Ditylum_brightwellii.AAC.2
MAHLNKAMSQVYWTIYGSDKKNKEENEIGLITVDETVCYNCNKKGHTSFQCLLKRSKGQGGGGRRGNCVLCGKENHTTKDYFKDPKNASKVPSWWRKCGKGNGSNNGGKGNDETRMYCQEVEMVLAAPKIQFPCTVKLLEDLNVWVADTGSSCNSTGSHDDMVNMRVPKTIEGVTLPDGKTKITSMIGDIQGTLCN